MTVIGADPGATGALVVLDGQTVVETWLADTRAKVPGYYVGGAPDPVALSRWFAAFPGATIVLETPFAPRMVGTANALTIGQNWGMLYAAARCSGLRVVSVTPAKWSRDLFGGKKGTTDREKKEAAVRFVSERLPGLSLVPAGAKVAHTGLADAAAIAIWGQRG